MASAEDGISILKGKEEDVIWLPAIVLLYIFTLSNDPTDFVAGIIAVVGARAFHDIVIQPQLLAKNSVIETSENIIESTENRFKSVTGLYQSIGLLVFAFSLVFYAPIRLSVFFSHDNLILVALAGVYWGSFAIGIVNFSKSNPILATISLVTVPYLVLFNPI